MTDTDRGRPQDDRHGFPTAVRFLGAQPEKNAKALHELFGNSSFADIVRRECDAKDMEICRLNGDGGIAIKIRFVMSDYLVESIGARFRSSEQGAQLSVLFSCVASVEKYSTPKVPITLIKGVKLIERGWSLSEVVVTFIPEGEPDLQFGLYEFIKYERDGFMLAYRS